MTFNQRFMIYGIPSDGKKEFLHSALGHDSAMSYVKKHNQLFRRYVHYELYVADRLRKRISV